MDEITTAMEEEEIALHNETSREQQQMMDKVEICRSIAIFQLLSYLQMYVLIGIKMFSPVHVAV